MMDTTRTDMDRTPGATRVYKILRADEWRQFSETGLFEGSPVDLTDGFIHLSAAHQVLETAARHFSREEGLALVTLTIEALEGQGIPLKWERSRGGHLFPHAYANLPLSAVKATAALPFDATIGCHSLIAPLIP